MCEQVYSEEKMDIINKEFVILEKYKVLHSGGNTLIRMQISPLCRHQKWV